MGVTVTRVNVAKGSEAGVQGLSHRWRWLLLLVTVLAVIRAVAAPLNADAAWMLYLADRVVTGAHLYRDLVEVNPPLMVWLLVPVAAAARVFGTTIGVLFTTSLLGLCIASAMAVWSLLRQHATRQVAEMLALGTLLALLAVPGGDFGEREQFALALMLPGLVALGVRRGGGAIGQGAALSLGIAAAVGIALKPFFVFAWVLAVAYVVAARGIGPTLRQTDVAVVPLLGFGYLLSVHLLTPEYWEIVRIYGAIYAGFGIRPLEYLILQLPVALVAVGAISWCLLARHTTLPPVAGVLLHAAIGFLIGVFLQHKGWTYHLIPVTGTALVLLLLLAVGPAREERPARIAQMAATGWVGITLLFIVVGEPLSNRNSAWRVNPSQLAVTKAAILKYPEAQSMLVLSSQLFDAFPLVHEVELRWTSSFPSLWFLQALYPTGDAHGFRDPASMTLVERDAWGRLVRDLRNQPPDLLLVERREANARRLGTRGIDFLSYLGRDPDAAVLLATYRVVDTAGPLTVWARNNLVAWR